MSSFQDGLSYSTFKTITDLFLRDVDTRGESEVKAQGFKAALAIDAIAKLTAIDNHPMNRMLGFGTKYLREYFSPWVQQNGGWVSSTHKENPFIRALWHICALGKPRQEECEFGSSLDYTMRP